MTREEAQRECERLAEQSPERATHTFMPRQDESGEWSVVKVALAPLQRPTGTVTESKPRPEQPGDPRVGKPNPFWGPIG